MLFQNLFKHFDTVFRLQLFLNHGMQQEITDGQKGTNFFVRELFLNTVVIVNAVEVKNQLVNFIDFVGWAFLDGVQIEDLGDDFSLITVGSSLS